jgi:hypothetical protein
MGAAFITWDLERHQENHETGINMMDRIEEIERRFVPLTANTSPDGELLEIPLRLSVKPDV